MYPSNQLLELMAQIMGAFQERFNKALSRKTTLLDWERRVFAFGSVKDRPRSGREKTREEPCAGVTASIKQSPSPFKSTCKRAAELDIPRTTMRDHMEKDLKRVCSDAASGCMDPHLSAQVDPAAEKIPFSCFGMLWVRGGARSANEKTRHFVSNIREL
ncbi:hypothetical protein C0J52_23698 [Blattella germanica]|nr:hypothetical protein C0J52_23698 [Blattella germanica]